MSKGGPQRYAITEGLGPDRALAFAARNLDRGVDMIQIREKQLSAPELKTLVQRVMAMPNPHGSKILVNSHVDIALACGAHGVHLPAGQRIPPSGDLPEGFLIGVSCHTREEVERAGLEGASFVVFGPVFTTGDKAPVGLQALSEAAHSVHIPVYALGGITEENAAPCIAAGAAGVAGIRLFASSQMPSRTHRQRLPPNLGGPPKLF
jgi:thiamine-phosphate pyrophosphorylase